MDRDLTRRAEASEEIPETQHRTNGHYIEQYKQALQCVEPGYGGEVKLEPDEDKRVVRLNLQEAAKELVLSRLASGQRQGTDQLQNHFPRRKGRRPKRGGRPRKQPPAPSSDEYEAHRIRQEMTESSKEMLDGVVIEPGGGMSPIRFIVADHDEQEAKPKRGRRPKKVQPEATENELPEVPTEPTPTIRRTKELSRPKMGKR